MAADGSSAGEQSRREQVQQDQAEAGWGGTNIRHLGYRWQARAAGVMRGAGDELFWGRRGRGGDEGAGVLVCW